MRPGPTPGRYLPHGGALASTLSDLARLLLLHRHAGVCDGQRIIPEDRLREMYRPALPRVGYGLGFMLSRRLPNGQPACIVHTGSSGTLCWLDFEHDVIGVLLTQCPRAPRRAPDRSKPRSPSFLRKVKQQVDAVFARTQPRPTLRAPTGQ